MDNLPDLSSVRLDTDRCVLRPYRAGDGTELTKAVQASLEDLRKPSAALFWALGTQTEEGLERFCQWSAAEFAARREFGFVLTYRRTQEILGAVGLHDPNWNIPSFEIGWWLRSDLHRQGLVSEAARAVIDWGLDTLNARRIFAEVDEENQASWGVCEKVGMTFEGLLRNLRVDHRGGMRHCRIYSATR